MGLEQLPNGPRAYSRILRSASYWHELRLGSTGEVSRDLRDSWANAGDAMRVLIHCVTEAGVEVAHFREPNMIHGYCDLGAVSLTAELARLRA
jgi:acetyl esterase/lipase